MKQTYKDLRELAQVTIDEAELKAGYQICDRRLRNTMVDSVGKLLYKFQDVREKHR